MKGIKGSTKTIGDPCAMCAEPLTEASAVKRRPPRSGLLSYCRPCLNARSRTDKAKATRRASMKTHRAKTRQMVQDAYGNACDCCGETTPEFLALDHVHNDGAAHRRETNNSPLQMYREVIRLGFPDRFQLLCHNCNCAKGWYGQCPHERDRSAS